MTLNIEWFIYFEISALWLIKCNMDPKLDCCLMTNACSAGLAIQLSDTWIPPRGLSSRAHSKYGTWDCIFTALIMDSLISGVFILSWNPFKSLDAAHFLYFKVLYYDVCVFSLFVCLFFRFFCLTILHFVQQNSCDLSSHVVVLVFCFLPIS